MSMELLKKKLQLDLEAFENPTTYQDGKYYDDCRAKADFIRELLSFIDHLEKIALDENFLERVQDIIDFDKSPPKTDEERAREMVEATPLCREEKEMLMDNFQRDKQRFGVGLALKGVRMNSKHLSKGLAK
jgi:hypothetical protein